MARTTAQELEARFWKALKSDMTMMIGLDGIEDGHARPMTAQLEGNRGPIWFFTAKDNGIVQKLGENDRAIATFASKGHDLFATVHGRLSLDNDRAIIDKLWNRWIAAWYEGRTRIIGVEPEAAPTLTRALAAGRPVDAEAGGIAADSLAPRRVGELGFPIARRYVERVVLARAVKAHLDHRVIVAGRRTIVFSTGV